MFTFAPVKQNNGAIAQLVEQRTENPCVPGSIPGGTTENQAVTVKSNCFFCAFSVVFPFKSYYFGSPRKVVEKAKNNYFCSMETGYELFLPEGILTYFEVTHADRTATAILIYLDEKDLSEEERSGKHLQSKGFYGSPDISLG